MNRKIKKTLCLIVFCCLLIFGCAGLKAVDEQPDASKTVTAVISVKDAPNPVRAFGLDLLYPNEVMTFQGIARGHLLQNGFPVFGSNIIGPGRLRIGGVEAGNNFIPEAASGELVRLTFKARRVQSSDFQIRELNSDFRSWLIGNHKHLVISFIMEN
jgi:hypothetical protein